MIFPYLIFLVGCVLVLGYFARRNVTWTAKAGTQGSLGMAVVVLLIGLGIGWGLDIYLDWSVIPQYMYAAGSALQGIAILFFVFYGLLCLSMLLSAGKVGTMVA